MKKYLFVSLWAFFVLFTFNGCEENIEIVDSDQIPQENIFQHYTASYNEENGECNISADFRVDNLTGKYVKLVSPSSISVNHHEMTRILGEYVSLQEQNKCPNQVVFKYVNNNKKSFTNKISIRSIRIAAQTLLFSKDATTYIPFSGKPLSENESIICLLWPVGSSMDNDPIELETSVVNKQIVIYPEYLEEIIKGNYQGSFVRQSIDLQIKGLERGGIAESSYTTKLKQITIK